MVNRSVVHWVGGKSRMLKHILERLPQKMNNYFEPFLGSGIVYLNLPRTRFKKAYINDINEELMNVYSFVKSSPVQLINKLRSMSSTFMKKIPEKRKLYFIRMKNKFNATARNTIGRAALYIFLNKTFCELSIRF